MIPEQKYLREAENAWQQSWDILHDDEGWTLQAGTEACRGCVYAKKFSKLGKLFRLEAQVDFSPQEVFDVLVPGVCDWPKWNPTILHCEVVQSLGENTDIAYSIAAPGAGGLVSSRDFVNLRHWKTQNGIAMSSAIAVSHPKTPVSKKHVRAENRPACYAFKPVEGEPNKCHFVCILNTDLKGWLPQFLIDQALSGVLMDYLKALKEHLRDRQSQRG